MFKNYELLYLGQSSPDRLLKISVSTELFDRHKNSDGQIVIGGGHNGSYYFVSAEVFEEDEFVGYDETINETGIDDLVDLVTTIQNHMGWDSGSYIKTRFLARLQTTMTPEEYDRVMECLRYPIQDYSGQSAT